MPELQLDTARIHWEERGEGPRVLVVPSWLTVPDVYVRLLDDLAQDHTVLTYDPRAAGASTGDPPYGMETDVADLIALLEALGAVDVLLATGDGTNRAVHVLARRPELARHLVSLGTVPGTRADAEGSEALVGSLPVLQALVRMLETDYRAGMWAVLERANPQMGEDELRERIELQLEYVSQEAAVARLRDWIGDDPADAALAVSERLTVVSEGSSPWFTTDLTERALARLPGARVRYVDDGALSRPDLSAAVVRELTAAARAAR